MKRAGTILALVILSLLGWPAPAAPQAPITLFVNNVDATCGGLSPCYATIQAAVNAAQPRDRIVIQAGTYVEQVSISGKNNTTTATEADRIIIQADPAAAVGSVTLFGAVAQCTTGHAIQLRQSKFVTLRGLTITGAGGPGVLLQGGNNQNQAIHLERLRIFGNGSTQCSGGITIQQGNPNTLILNSLIYANGQNGIAFVATDGGPHYVIGNTIHANGWNGVHAGANQGVWLVNTLMTGNGTDLAATGDGFGVNRVPGSTPQPTGIHLLNNLICGNRLGEINGPALDATDANNLTPTGTEGPGVSASPGCELPGTVYKNVNGPDGFPNTADDDFALVKGSPAIDHGMDPRTLGLDPALNPLLEADYASEGARPKDGDGNGTAEFDMGALEFNRDVTPPTVTFLDPLANTFVRQTVTVRAEATDSESGVQDVTLSAGTQSLTTSLSPTPPASPVTATASWNTTTFPDGIHTLTATATDVAGNTASTTRTVVVDNTPPDTQITGGPAGEINTTAATFTFTGTDNLTPATSLVFSWSLDGAPFTAFSLNTTATFTGLAEGTHTFQVKARDLAGNEDPTPAVRSFTVALKPEITSVDPPSGPVGTFVTITGARFTPGPTQVAFNGVAGVLYSVTATRITTTVSLGATSGLLTVTTPKGTASQPFTVTTSGDFTLTAQPATVRAIAGDQGSAHIQTGGSGSFTSLVSLTVSGAPAGITPTLSGALVAPGAGADLTFSVASTVTPGSYGFTVTGRAQVDGQTLTRTTLVTLEVLAASTQAVTGRVLTAEAVPQPIPGVTVVLGAAFTLTDAGGNFLLPAPPAGPNMLLVDGRTASTPSAQYPPVEVNITVGASGPTRVPFIIFLPKLDTARPVTLPLDATGTTTQEVRATTPMIPGLEVVIPAGTRIVGPDGNPVSQITITPVPVDRSPMPFPAGVTAVQLFTIQPGGAVPSQPLPITFPNVQQAPPGSKADLYFFDLVTGGWKVWGTGTVSADGRQIVSDPGFGLPRFAWHFAAIPVTLVSLLDEVRIRNAQGGEPVDLVTGRFTVRQTDLVLPGRLPVTIQRSYRSENSQPGLFGIGWTLAPYDSTITTAGTSLRLILPDQSRYLFTPTGASQWQNTTEPAFRGAVLTQLAGFNFQLRLKDGTVQRYAAISGFTNLAGLSAIVDRTGNTVTLTRDTTAQSRRILQITEPGGRAVTFTYDPAGRISQIRDPIGRLVQYTYDGLGRLATVTDPAGGVTQYAYDTSHRILSITDTRGITYLTNEYDGNGRVVRQTQADGGVWTFAYTLVGNLVTETTVTDPRGNPTTYRFDSRGFTVSQTDALGQTSTFEYDPGSNLLTAVTDALGRLTRFAYDAQGNVTSITDPARNVRTFTYQPTFNRVTSITDPLGNVTRFEYDLAGNLTAIVDPLLARTTIAYNAAGQPVSATDPLLNTTTFGYDPVGNLTAITDPLGNRTTREYDGVSRLTRQIDPRGKPSAFAYDPLNRLTQLTDALGGVTSFSYDPNGNLLFVADARGNAITHTYDSMDRLATRTDPVGAVESFAYDGAGNLLRHTDRKGQVATFGYDGLDRRNTASYADGSSTSFTYDSVGRLVQASDSVGGTILNGYDLLDRLTAQSTGLGTISYQYDALGRRTRMDAPGQASVFYGYDPASRLRTITQAPLNPVSIDYDALGRRTLLTLPNGVSTAYQYDAASRLTALIYRNALGPLGDLTYQYDPAGNRTSVSGSFARTLLPDPVASATYDAANRQLTFGAKSMIYDANGSVTSIMEPSGVTILTWNARNRLAAISKGDVNISFTYDSTGRRIDKEITGQRTRYLYDSDDFIQEFVPNSSVAYLRGQDIDEPLVRNGSDHYLLDALGSVLGLTDASGTISTRYNYDPFGDTIQEGSISPNAFQYTGRERESVAGLYFYRRRYYSTELRRFLSTDPLAGRGNLYTYVRNNPLRFTDPFGLKEKNLVARDVSFNPDEGEFQLVAQAPAGLPIELLDQLLKLSELAGPLYRNTIEIGRRDYLTYKAIGIHQPSQAGSVVNWSSVDWSIYDAGTFEGTLQRLQQEAGRQRQRTF